MYMLELRPTLQQAIIHGFHAAVQTRILKANKLWFVMAKARRNMLELRPKPPGPIIHCFHAAVQKEKFTNRYSEDSAKIHI